MKLTLTCDTGQRVTASPIKSQNAYNCEENCARAYLKRESVRERLRCWDKLSGADQWAVWVQGNLEEGQLCLSTVYSESVLSASTNVWLGNTPLFPQKEEGAGEKEVWAPDPDKQQMMDG